MEADTIFTPLRRWGPALIPGGILVVCAFVFMAQQEALRGVKADIRALSQTPLPKSTTQPAAPAAATPAGTAEPKQEMNRLKEVAARLQAEIAELERLKSDSLKLRAQLLAPPGFELTAEETEALAKAKEKADSITCINNLKQFGLSVRVWALDNEDSNPPNVLCMSNELSTPKILICPADTMRQTAADWSSFTMANCSYEFLAPNDKDADNEPQRLLSRCPIHGHIGLCDGSVQSNVAKNHPDWFVERNGKIYFEPAINALPAPPEAAEKLPTSREEEVKMFRERYGLEPGAAATP